MKISVIELQDFAIRCFVEVGVPENEAGIIAETLTEADARGVHSHGLIRLPTYVQRIRKGLVLAKSDISVEEDTETSAILNGGCSAGQVVGTSAVNLAIEKALAQGLGAVAAKNSNHFGIAAHYALIASQRDMVGIVMSNTFPLMPAIGGAEKVIGNNPIAVAVPSNNRHPFVLDIAMSSVAMGKIRFAQATGSLVPDTWGVNADGTPTVDPSEILHGGLIKSMAGPKGFGMALVVEALTSVLAGGASPQKVGSMHDPTQRQSVSHFMLVVDVAHFLPIDLFKQRMSLLSSSIKASKRAKGAEEIFLPGELEFSLEEDRMKFGIPIEKNVLQELKELASNLGVPFPEQH